MVKFHAKATLHFVGKGMTMEREENRNHEMEERTLMEDVFHYLSILSRYKVLIILITVVAAAGAVGYAFLSMTLPPEKSPMPNQYTSTARLLFQQGEEVSAADALLTSLGINRGSGGRANGQLALQVLQSNEVVDQLVEEFDIVEQIGATDSIRTKSRLTVLGGAVFSYDDKLGILTIHYTSTDPQYSYDMTSRMVELLSAWFRTKGTTSQQQQRQVLEAKLQEVSVQINTLESEIEDFQREHGIMGVQDISNRQQVLLNDLRNRLMLKEMELQNYQKFSRIEDANLLRLRRERDSLSELIRQVERGEYAGAEDVPLTKDLPELARQLNTLNRDLEIQSRIYQTLLQQYEVAKLELGRDPVFQILERPEVPDKRSGPHRAQMVGTVVGGAFAASIALALALHTIRTTRERMRFREQERSDRSADHPSRPLVSR